MGILLLAGAIWRHSLELAPSVTIPSPTLPSPNAFDRYVAAGAALVEENAVSDATAGRSGKTGIRRGRPYTVAERQTLVTHNAAALRLLRQASGMSYLEPPLRSTRQDTNYYTRFRGLARLLRLEGQVRAAQGDWPGAVSSNLDVLQLGEQELHGAPLIGRLVSAGVEAVGRADLWSAVDHLDAAHARSAAERLERIFEDPVPLYETFQEERWYTEGYLMETMARPNWRRALGPSSASSSGGLAQTREDWDLWLRLQSTGKRRLIADYDRRMDQIVTAAQGAYATQSPEPSSDALIDMFAVSPTMVRLSVARNSALNGMLPVAFALRAYQVEHGHSPAGLAELTPQYLKRLPDDPFALKGTFRYAPQGRRYRLYSVGPDGKDDGGTPVSDRTVTAASTGDIVAGANLH